MFELKHIDKSFRDRDDIIHVARDLSWCLGSGEGVALMGESGAGKTTLMNIIRVAPDTELAGYPAILFCRISGIRPDIWLNS